VQLIFDLNMQDTLRDVTSFLHRYRYRGT